MSQNTTTSTGAPSATDLLRMASGAIETKDFAGAEQALRAATALAPNDPVIAHHLAVVLVNTARNEEAVAVLTNQARSGALPASLVLLAGLFEGVGRARDAHQCYEIALKGEPKNFDALMKFGALKEAMQDKPGARDCYRRALEARPRDYNATSKYTGLIFDKEPELSVHLWQEVLAGAGDNLDLRSAALDQLVCHKEWWERIKRGEMPYHAARLSDLFFTYAAEEVKEWDAVNQQRLAANPSHPHLLATAGLSRFCLRDRHGAQRLFSATPQKMAGHLLEAVRFEPGFYDELRAFTDSDLTRTLPPVINVVPLVPDGKGILYLSCNFTYFRGFALPMIVSMRENSPQTPVHIHIMDATEDEVALARTFLERLSPIKFALSIERPGLANAPVQEARSYYHAVRFIRFYEHLRHYGVPLWLMDVDAVINANLDGLFSMLEGNDVAMRIRPGRKEPWNQFNACVVGAGTSDASLEYFRLIAAYLAYFFQRNGLRWGIDQLAMYGVFADMEDRGEAPHLALLGEREVDYSYRDDGYVWCNSGAGKFQHLKRIANPRSLPLANFDGNKFVDVFERHWKECERIATKS